MWHQVNSAIVSIVPKCWPFSASVSGRSSPGGPGHGAGLSGGFGPDLGDERARQEKAPGSLSPGADTSGPQCGRSPGH